MLPRPHRGDVWLIDFDPVRGHEQGGRRPGLVISTDTYNRGAAELHVALPITSHAGPVRWRVAVQPPEGGLHVVSYIKCDEPRALSIERFIERWGEMSRSVMRDVSQRLRTLMEL